MKRIGLFLILYIVTTILCFGQLPHTFTQYTSEDGLSQNTIMSILQDEKGIMCHFVFPTEETDLNSLCR